MPDTPLSPHPLSYAPPTPRQSRTGIISFLCGLIAVFSLGLSLTAVQRPPGSLPAYTSFIGTLIFGALLAAVVLGLVTGVLGIMPPRRKPTLALIGLTLNGLVSLYIFLLIIASQPHS